MILKGLRLRAQTSLGEVGATFRFSDGLVLLRADGARGKSNSVLGIVYALGLEGMLGPSRTVPLKHAMTHSVEVDGTDYEVMASDVLLELTNAEGRTITILRTVKGDRKPELVTVFEGAVLEQDLVGLRGTDYFVRLGGAATHEKGFHHFLASFFGWSLPRVLAYTGESVPLYMESIFPLIFVEQMRGWSAIEGRFPTHLRIREPGVRAAEFLLGLEVHDVELKRAKMLRELDSVRSSWTSNLHGLEALAKQLGVVVSGVPVQPVADWPPVERVELAISRSEEWVPLGIYVRELEEALFSLADSSNESVEQAAPRLESELAAAEQRARAVEVWVAGVTQEVDALRADFDRTTERIHAIEEDLVRNKDAMTLRRLGSTHALSIADDTCPTCHQDVGLALLPDVRTAGASPMSLEENVQYLEDQRDMLRLIAAQTREAFEASLRRAASGQEELNAARAAIRSIKGALIAHPRTVSTTAIAERVRLENRLDGLKRVLRQASEMIDTFAHLADRWGEAQRALKALPSNRLSASDIHKLQALQDSFTSQVVAYNLSSVIDPTDIVIDHDTLRPDYRGFDLQFDLAGSDATRATWAYRCSFLEVAREFRTNHPGFLVIDEPQQQHPSMESYAAFLQRVSSSKSFGQQVLIATNEEANTLKSLLDGHPFQLLDFGDAHIMRPRS